MMALATHDAATAAAAPTAAASCAAAAADASAAAWAAARAQGAAFIERSVVAGDAALKCALADAFSTSLAPAAPIDATALIAEISRVATVV